MAETTENCDVRRLREDRGWTQAEMAEFLGVNQSTVSRIENGEQPARPVRKLLRILADRPRDAAE